MRTEPPGVAILISSTYIDLVCEPDTSSINVTNIVFTWTGPNGMISNGSDYTVTNQADNSTLRIAELDDHRDNNAAYTCSVSGDVQGNNSLTLSVRGMLKTICF